MSSRTVELTPQEERLRVLLVEAASRISNENPNIDPIVLRWAGGWVRDKLLGTESHDIDTAINSMTGVEFTTGLLEFCKREDMAKKHNITSEDVGRLATIQRNPEKSKNLETATVRLLGMECDFVNLRKEAYLDDSRNPEMEFGTAEEDAERRDATVNALFYNIHTCQVEDLVGGIPDIEAKIIRTPLEPFQTFMDDPLRVLRLIRFASRLEFTIDSKVETSMGDHRVLDALRLKISRERIGVEMEKMLKGKHPLESLKLIHRLGIYHTVFTDPTKTEMAKPDLSQWETVYECLEDLSQNRTPGSIWNVLVRCSEDAYFAWVLAALTPWLSIHDHQALRKLKDSPQPSKVAREGLKATRKLCDLVTGACMHREDITTMKIAICEKASFINERDRLGMAIREWDKHGGAWRLRLLAAILQDVMENARKVDPIPMMKLLAGWQQFLDHLEDLEIMDSPSLKRMIQGTELAKALGIKPGKWMTAALDMCIAWQLRNPGATDATGAIEEVKNRSKELGLDVSAN